MRPPAGSRRQAQGDAVSTAAGRQGAPRGTLVLTRQEIATLLSLDDCVALVEEAFRSHAEGRSFPPAVLGVQTLDGGFHVKAAGLRLARDYFAAKINGNFPQNLQRVGLPAIQGIIVLCDAGNGYPLAIMDSMEITALRTAAATAIAARHLARADARVLTICGCGTQGRVHARALAKVLPLVRIYAHDRDARQAEAFARELSVDLGLEFLAVDDLAAAVRNSDVCVTCTPSHEPLLGPEDVRPGTFVAAVGADAPEKQELDPRLLAAATVVVDHLDQCATIGELHHALESGLLTRTDVHAELPEVVAGLRSGRTAASEITVFDSTGTALQDVAAAAAAYERALTAGRGVAVTLGS